MQTLKKKEAPIPRPSDCDEQSVFSAADWLHLLLLEPVACVQSAQQRNSWCSDRAGTENICTQTQTQTRTYSSVK